MCLLAIHWADIRQCYVIADSRCAAKYGFDDSLLYDELKKPIPQREMFVKQQTNLFSEVKNLFEYWKAKGLPIC